MFILLGSELETDATCAIPNHHTKYVQEVRGAAWHSGQHSCFRTQLPEV